MTDTSDRVFERLLARLPPDRPYTFDALSEADVPAGVAHFLAQTMQRRLELEADALAASRSRWFDYGSAELQRAQSDYLASLARHAQVPAEEWHRTLRQAVVQVVPYLVQPARTLVRFVFPPGRDELPAHVVRRRMRYFNAYGYLSDVVHAYLEQKGEDRVTRDGLTRLLQRIEHRTPAEYAPEEWVTLLDQLYETVGEGAPQVVPTALLGRFFRDKGMREQAQTVEAFAESITADELLAILRRRAPAPEPEPDSPPVATPPVPDVPPVAAPPDADPLSPPDAVQAPEPAVQDAPQPLWRQFVRDAAAAPVVQSPGEAQPLWKRFGASKASAPGAPPPARDGRLDEVERRALGTVPAPQRRLYVRDLFSGSERAYGETLERIAQARTWSEASRVLGAAYRDHQVNIYSASAVAFTEAAERRFEG